MYFTRNIREKLNGGWNCTFCEDPEVIDEPTLNDYLVGGGTKRKVPTGLHGKELKVCERVLLELFCHSASTAFHEPVSKAVPNYYRIITNPMDFTTIKYKLSRQHFNHYKDVERFIADIKLVFKNCSLYNSVSVLIAPSIFSSIFTHDSQNVLSDYVNV
eukprot:XP_014777367.1 PREDICTED: E3 ubiquitin-protein ligase TRIM33-like [Octopus bimaculoides]